MKNNEILKEVIIIDGNLDSINKALVEKKLC